MIPLPASARANPVSADRPKNHIDFKEFENAAQDPFETLELKTLDDRAELYKVLSGDTDPEPHQPQPSSVPLTTYKTQAQQSGFVQHQASQPPTGAPSLASVSQYSLMSQVSTKTNQTVIPTTHMPHSYHPVGTGWSAQSHAQYGSVNNSTSYGRITGGNPFASNPVHGSQSFGDVSQASGTSQSNFQFNTWNPAAGGYTPFSAYGNYPAHPVRARSISSVSQAGTSSQTPSIVQQQSHFSQTRVSPPGTTAAPSGPPGQTGMTSSAAVRHPQPAAHTSNTSATHQNPAAMSQRLYSEFCQKQSAYARGHGNENKNCGGSHSQNNSRSNTPESFSRKIRTAKSANDLNSQEHGNLNRVQQVWITNVLVDFLSIYNTRLSY